MIKKFCDCCGEPAVDWDKIRMMRGHIDASKGGNDNRTKAAVDLTFGFEGHPTKSNDTEPDLCGPCILKLIDDARATVATYL